MWFLSVAHIFIQSITTIIPFWTSDTSKPSYWFSLGDSYTATRFNASGPLPSPENPFGNPLYPDTITGGPYWVNYLTTTYNQTPTLTYNFAVSGATVNGSLFPPSRRVTLEDEVNTYLVKFAQKPTSTPWESGNTLFSVWIGINDVQRMSYYDPGDRDALSDAVLDSYFNLVEQLVSFYLTGARLFLFINIPPIDRTPRMLRSSLSEQDKMKTAVETFNPKLQTRIDDFRQHHTNVTIWTWDSHAMFTTILDYPTGYGFKDIVFWDPVDPSFFWGNDFHPSSAAHDVFAREIRAKLTNFPW